MTESVKSAKHNRRIAKAQAVAKKNGWPVEAVRNVQDAAAVEDGCWYDSAAADRVIEFFCKVLKHSKGQWAGKPFVPLEWQECDILRPLFGWKRADGTRRFRKGYIEVAKKNGKTTLCAGIILYMLCADGEQGAEVYSAAYDSAQASIIYKEVASMIRKSPGLLQRLNIMKSIREVEYEDKSATYKVLSRDSYATEGINIHLLIFDEFHTQKTRDLYEALEYGGEARQQPLEIKITTAGSNKYTICYEEHELAERILSGEYMDWSRFAYMANATKEDIAEEGWKRPEVWAKANPSYGVTVFADKFEEAIRAIEENPSKLNAFLRYRLSIWTDTDEAYISSTEWEMGEDRYEPDDCAGLPCCFGLDLSSKTDLTALSVAWHDSESDMIYTAAHFWLPAEYHEDGVNKGMAAREHRDKVPYGLWASQGWLTLCPGNVIDYEFVEQQIIEWAERFRPRQVAYDPYKATQMALKLQDRHGLPMVEFRQGNVSMDAPLGELEKRLKSCKIKHNGNPCLTWNAQCLSVKEGPTHLKSPIKPPSNAYGKRIDGMVALLMALGRVIAYVEEEPPAPRVRWLD